MLIWPAVTLSLGLLAGSLIGLLSLRLPAGEPVGMSRSRCGGCGRRLGVADLVPIASFLAFRGRCRTCGGAIPRRYPALELVALAVAGWSVLAFDGPLALWSAVLGWQLLLLAALDLEHFWLPRALTGALIATGLAVAAALGVEHLRDHAIGAAAGFASLALIAAAYRRLRRREGLGGGDAYLLAGAGAWTGWMGLPSVLVIAALAGLAIAGAARLVGRPIRADQPLPFGVFLALGAWLVWLYGPIGVGRIPV